MNFALIYILHRFLYRLVDFLHHWYVHGSRWLFHYFISTLENIDRTVALRITLKYFFEPLYKDYTFIGRILGIIFRSGRVLGGFAVYTVFVLVFLPIYIAWLFIPPALLFYVLQQEVFKN